MYEGIGITGKTKLNKQPFHGKFSLWKFPYKNENMLRVLDHGVSEIQCGVNVRVVIVAGFTKSVSFLPFGGVICRKAHSVSAIDSG